MSKLQFMEKLLDGVEVEWKPLGELGKVYGGLSGKSKADFTNGNAAFITYRNVFFNHSLDTNLVGTVKIVEGEKQRTLEYGDIVFTGSSENIDESGLSSVITERIKIPLYLNSFCFFLRFDDQNLFDPHFTKYLFRSKNIRKQIVKTASGVTRFNVSKEKMKKILIPIPPLHVQAEIVRILDNLTELTAELTARKKQYAYYRDKLLTFADGEVVPIKLLKDIVVIRRGKRLVKNQLETKGKYKVYQNSMVPLGYYHNYNVGDNSAFIIAAGSAGEVGYSYKEFWAADDVFYFEKNNEILSKFIYYVLKINNNRIMSNVRRSSVPRLPREAIERIPIPIPPLKEQQRIVSILDKFETLTTSITEGLPREIALRQKQYEYYRDLLLSFPQEEEGR